MNDSANAVFHKKLGAKPGTPIYTGNYTEEPTDFSVLSYNPDELIERKVDPADFIRCSDTTHVNWYNYTGLNDTKNFEKIADIFRVPHLMQEDILHTRQRSKFEVRGAKSLSILPVPRLEFGNLVWQQASIYHHKDEILTFTERSSPTFELVKERIRNKSGRIRSSKSDYLLYALTDAVVDQYLNITQYLINETDELELDLLSTKGKIPKNFVQELYSRKKDLLHLLKRIGQIESMVNDLKVYFESDDDLDQAYITDLQDHVIRIKDNLNHLRQMLTELMNQYLAMNSDHMNEIMKTLTIFSAIFIPLGFIAGLYGMNFNGEISKFNMPELNFKFGYITVLAVMASFVGGLLLYFKKKNWL